MYAIVRAGGKQLRVSPGDVVRIEKPAGEFSKGGELRLSEIVFAGGDGDESRDPKKLTVKATVLNEVRGPKVMVFKKKRTKQYRRTKGHRQTMIEIRIDAIERA